MKRILLLLLLLSAVSQAQIVNIPDANFKAALISLGKDLNGDGEIQTIEALAITTLSVNTSNISNLEGIQAFANLITLRCVYNNLSSLDVSGMVHLTTLDCYRNLPMTTLNVSGCVALTSCKAYECSITDFDISNHVALTELKMHSNQLSSLNISGCPELNWLDVSDNELTSLNISDNPKITYLDAHQNQLSTLNASNLGLLTPTDLVINNNLITDISINNSRFGFFWCTNNHLSTIDMSTTQASNIQLSDNLLSSIIWPQSGSIFYLKISNNPLTVLDLSNVQFNPQATVEVSNIPSLEYVFAKNGTNETISSASGTNPVFICVDDMQVQAAQNNFPNTVVSSYCTFTPGGDYNTITGKAIFDANGNGCDTLDTKYPFMKFNLSNDDNNYSMFTSADGVFTNFVQTGTFNISIGMENTSLFTNTPQLATIVFDNANDNIATQDFCISANGVQPDIETVIVPFVNARPGFDAIYKVIYKNKGNQILSGNVDLTYQENELDFVNASIVPDAQSSGVLSWNFSNLYPFESRSIEVRLNVNSPQETPAVNIGDQLNFLVQAGPFAGDITPDDNDFSFSQTVVGSYDPNDITCLEGEHVNPTEIGKYLHYNINFENTGTAAAENIVVKDMIDLTKYDISSLQLLDASHSVTTRITNNKVEFIFEGINLGASEHGNVTFKIKTKNTLVTGNSVSQKADIYFDYNFPVATNVAMTTFDTLGTDHPVLESDISFYPNPVSDMLNVSSVEHIRRINLYDLRGRLLQTVSEGNTIKLAEIPSGIYLIQAFTDAGSKSEKIIKR